MKSVSMRRKGSIILAAVLALILCGASPAFALGSSGAFSSDNTDYVKNGTGNNTSARQTNAAYTTWLNNNGERQIIGRDSGVVTLGKILNVNRQNRFPKVKDFVYKITPVSAWDNANTDTEKSGTAIAKADMPKPSSGGGNADHHAQIKGSGNDWYSLVTIGNFREENDANTSAITNSDAASNTAGTEQKYRRTRTTDLKFTFAKAGYYMYKVEEVEPADKTAGMDYDNNTYYMVFYVANLQAAADSADLDEYGHGTRTGDTQTGVYVHTITSWTNSPETDKKAADLQDGDELNNGRDLMNQMDNGGTPAKPNTGRVDENSRLADGSSSVTHDNTGKVGASIPGPPPGEGPPDPDRPPSARDNYITAGPNTLEAFRMWNAQTCRDIVLKKKVTGNLGDRTKQFEFTVILSGLEPEQTYTADLQAEGTDSGDVTTSGVTLSDASADGNGRVCAIAGDGRSFTASDAGTAVFKVKLRDGEMLVLNALPRTSSYQIREAASDHVPQYEIVSTNKAKTEGAPIIAKAEDKTITASNTALSTDVEFVDRTDGTVTVIYRNNRDLATITGVPAMNHAAGGLATLILILSAFGVYRRRRMYAADAD